MQPLETGDGSLLWHRRNNGSGSTAPPAADTGGPVVAMTTGGPVVAMTTGGPVVAMTTGGPVVAMITSPASLWCMNRGDWE